jgi:hypothetical protein
MHRAVFKPSRRSTALMHVVLVVAAGVSVLVLTGSVAVLVMQASRFSPLGSSKAL